MYCLRRATLRLLSSPSLSASSASSASVRARYAVGITPSSTLPISVLARCSIPSNLQSRWNSSSSDSNNDEPPAYESQFSAPEETQSYAHPEERESRSHRERRDIMMDQASPKPTVFVGNLFFDVTAEDLRAQFEQYGTVESALIVHDNRGLSKGFGYVKFSTIEEATKAIENLNLQVFEGRHIRVQYAQTDAREFQEKNDPTKILFLGNLAYELTDRDLNAIFQDIKNIIDVRVPVDRRTGLARGFAHVEFLNVESAMKAMEILSRKAPYGRKLKVDYAQHRARSMHRPWPDVTGDAPGVSGEH